MHVHQSHTTATTRHTISPKQLRWASFLVFSESAPPELTSDEDIFDRGEDNDWLLNDGGGVCLVTGGAEVVCGIDKGTTVVSSDKAKMELDDSLVRRAGRGDEYLTGFLGLGRKRACS